jgi:TRAP-type C4-dicarboxylate transport system permease small subunit
MDAAKRIVDTILASALVIIFALLVGCVMWQVASRYVFSAPSTMTDELARLLLIWLAMLGAAYTLGQRRHLAINLIGSGVPPQRLRPLNLLLTALIAAFAVGVMIHGGWRLVSGIFATGQVTPTLRLPGGVLYLGVPISGALILFYCAVIVRDILGPEAQGPTEIVREDPISTEPQA